MKILIAERLRELRKISGLNKTQLAKKVGISDTAIGKWENGLQNPNINCLWKLANFFDVSVDYLIGRRDIE